MNAVRSALAKLRGSVPTSSSIDGVTLRAQPARTEQPYSVWPFRNAEAPETKQTTATDLMSKLKVDTSVVNDYAKRAASYVDPRPAVKDAAARAAEAASSYTHAASTAASSAVTGATQKLVSAAGSAGTAVTEAAAAPARAAQRHVRSALILGVIGVSVVAFAYGAGNSAPKALAQYWAEMAKYRADQRHAADKS